MTFFWPHAFWLLLIPLVLLGCDLIRRRGAATSVQPKILQAEAHHSSLVLRPRAFQRAANERVGGRIRVLLYLAIAAASFALARPQWGKLEEPVFDQAREIVIALDLSRSMQSEDVKPSRLERARLLITSLLERLKGERVGLIVFSGTAFLQSPLSSDYEILRDFLPLLNPDYLPEGGTNYNALLETTIGAFGSSNAADRFLIVLSDGEAQSDDWQKYNEQLKTKGIRVLSLGIGTSGGAMIPDGSGSFVKDDRGAVVLSRLNPATLRELAKKTDGVYADASDWVDLAQLIQATVDQGKRGEFKETTKARLAERFQWPLAAAVLLFLLSFWREFPVTPKPRAIQLAGGGPPSLPRSALVIAAFILTSFAFLNGPSAFAQAPTKTSPKASTTPSSASPVASTPAAAEPAPLSAPVTQIVGRLSTHAQPSAKDYAELAQSTVTFGERAKSANETVPEGAVRDGLAAAQAGEALDGKVADWPALKKQLNALLPKKDPPPPPKKDDKKKDDKKPQDKKGEKGDQSKSDPKDQQPKDGDKGADKSEDGKPSPQDGKKAQSGQPKDPSKPGEDSGSDKADPNNSDDKKSGKPSAGASDQSPPSDKPQSDKPGQDAFGKMNPDDKEKDPKNAGKPQPIPTPPPDLSEKPPANDGQSGEMQQVGGTPSQTSTDPARLDPTMSVPMQKLDRVKEADSPARLFQLLQGPPSDQPAAKGKDW